MKGHHKAIDSPPMVERKAAVFAMGELHGEPAVMVMVGSKTFLYSPMEARQLAKDLNEALEALAGD